jgi:cytidylate kinase
MKRIVIAVDGFSSSGKSTMAKDLAKEIGYTYVDSGAMYRAVTLYCQENGLINNNQVDETALQQQINNIHIEFKINPETGRSETFLNGKNVENKIRSLAVSGQVSIVSSIGFVRKAMVSQQQSYNKNKGIVMDGRDIGTVVFPDAELKIFVTASPEIRAQRRFDELKQKGQEESFESILENIRSRDYMDQNRAESPLRKPDDAIMLDNGTMTPEEQKEWLLALFKERAERE